MATRRFSKWGKTVLPDPHELNLGNPPTKAIPNYDGSLVNISGLELIVNADFFQRTRGIKQLGTVHHAFPSARHTRFEHEIDVLHILRMMDRYLAISAIYGKEVALTIFAAGLLHDVGHGPYSHVLEELNGPKSHNENTPKIVKEFFVEPLEKSNIDLESVLALLDPDCNHVFARLITKDKALSADKLSYAVLDMHALGRKLNFPMNNIIQYTKIRGNEYGVDIRFRGSIKEFLQHYARLHEEAYLRKSPILAQRHMQKLAEFAIAAGDLKLEDIPYMEDSNIDEVLAKCSDERVSKAFRQYFRSGYDFKLSRRDEQRRYRDPLRTAVVIRLPQHEKLETRKADLYVNALKIDLMNAFSSRYGTAQRMTQLEKKFATEFDLPEENTVIALIPSHRLDPTNSNVTIFNQEEPNLLFNLDPDFKVDLQNSLSVNFAIRVAVPHHYRKTIAAKGPKVVNYFKELLSA